MKLYRVKQIIISLVLILPMLFLFIGCNDEVVKDKSKSSTESSTTTSTTVTTTQVTISEVESTYNKVRNMTIYNLTEKTSSMTGT